MTPEEKLFQIVEHAAGDDLTRARQAFGRLSDAELDKPYGQSGQTCRQILKQYEDANALYLAARDLLYQKFGRTRRPRPAFTSGANPWDR